MQTQTVNGVQLYYEEQGSGAPILCVHGAGSSSIGWAGAAQELAKLGRVITYDRRGCARSERPEPYERTSIAEQADDAAALIDALAAKPAVVIGRSYGGTLAIDLAIRYPELVRALVLLEPDASRELAPAAVAWVESVGRRLREVATRLGMDAVAEALITEIAGEDAWGSFPEEVRRTLSGNGPAILAELEGGWWLDADPASIAKIERPTLVVMAADSPLEFHQAPEALAKAIPNARLSQVGGGHIIDPAGPEVTAFVEKVLQESVAA